ncbi:MAG: nuclear transport factor 2 family protein [Rhizobiaceae bacterium]|nr:nuclear transport factor 2 family protein [Rhizobiaceae bacterium]
MTGKMSAPEDRIAQLESRISLLEDRLAILDLIASYGPAVDGMDGGALAAMWGENGSYDFGGDPLVGRENVAALIDLDTHRAYVSAGSAHVLSNPRITLEGDRAVVVNYSQVFTKAGDGWRTDRTCANRWELRRTADGWKVESRTNRLLDGSEEARLLLGGRHSLR